MSGLLNSSFLGSPASPPPAAFVTSWAHSTPSNPIDSANVSFASAGKYVVSMFVMGPIDSVLVGVRVNSVAATLRKRNTTVNVANLVGLFEIDIATPGTYSVETEWQGGSNMSRLVGAVHYVGSRSFVNSSESVANPVDLSMNTQADDVFIGMAVSDSGTITFSPTGYTEDYEQITDTSRTTAGGMNGACTGESPETFLFNVAGTPGNLFGAGVLYR